MANVMVIGVGGTNGSGKDTVMNFIADNYNYLFVSATDLLSTELLNNNLPTDRLHKAELSAKWRRQHGMGVVVDKAYQAFKSQPDGKFAGLVVGSLRHPAEVDSIHALGGKVLWIDADSHIRYERVQSANRTGRGLEDMISYEQFMADEEREMHPIGDSATLSLAGVKAKSDFAIVNEGTVQELETQLKDVII